MLINHDRRFIFFHVPKTAGTSTRTALAKLPGSIRVNGTKHLTPTDFAARHQELAARVLPAYFSFCFVRDPWERFGSLHRYLGLLDRPRPADLNDFAMALEARAPWLMRMHSIKPQCSFATGLSFVGRFERLEQDLAQIAQLAGLPHLKLEHSTASGEPVRYRERMNARSQAIIADFYTEDIERFGYG